MLYNNLTWDFIKTNLNRQWDWNALSKHSTITFDIIKANPTLPWNWDDISMNPNITVAIIKQYPQYPWNLYYFASQNKTVTEATITANPDFKWNIIHLCSNDNISWYFMVKHYNITKLDWSAMSTKPLLLPIVSTLRHKSIALIKAHNTDIVTLYPHLQVEIRS